MRVAVQLQLKIVDDPRAATVPFFRSMRHPDPRARDGFHADMQGVIDKITERAKVKKLVRCFALHILSSPCMVYDSLYTI